MRALLKFSVLPGALALAALASFLAPRAGAVAPPADPTGGYAGRVTSKFYPLSAASSPSRGTDTATVMVIFNPPMLHMDVTVDGDSGPEVYILDGSYGLGRFWATGPGPGGLTFISGKFTGAPGKIKLTGSGIVTRPDALMEIKVVLKQQPPL